MKTLLHKNRAMMIAAGVFVLAAVICILCLALRGALRRADVPAPTPTAAGDAPASHPKPSVTPEPAITPPAAHPEDPASGSDIYVSIQLPATDSDLKLTE